MLRTAMTPTLTSTQAHGYELLRTILWLNP
jgi:hypothetical protein